MERAREFLLRHASTALLLPDGDADGLSSGVLLERTLRRLDAGACRRLEPLLMRKGESVFASAARARLRERAPGTIVLLDQGSRGDEVLTEVPLLVIDHHAPRGFPPGSLACSAFGHEPTATTSVLTRELVRVLADIPELMWLAALGAIADLGPNAPFDVVRPTFDRYGRKAMTEAVALLNAPRRSAEHDVETAWKVLLDAESPREIAFGSSLEVQTLRARRAEVQHEVARCGRTAPRFAGRLALLLFQSQAKVHPLLAERWTSRLKGYTVIAANAGYLPGRVNFSVRTTTGEDLIAILRRHAPVDAPEFAHGHPQATGGSLTFEQFGTLLASLGFGEKDQSAALEAR